MEPHVALAFKMLEMHLDEMLPSAFSDFLNPLWRVDMVAHGMIFSKTALEEFRSSLLIGITF